LLKSGKAFTVLEDDHVLQDYCRQLIGLLTYLDHSKKNPSHPPLPLTDEQKCMVNQFFQCLEKNTKDMDLLHQLFYTLSAPPDESQPIDKWNDVLLCYLAISHACVDGTVKPVSLGIKDFSMWEYLTQSGELYEMSLFNTSLGEIERYENSIVEK
jgi:hypothetical protein